MTKNRNSIRIGMFFIAVVFLSFVVGMAVSSTRVFPYSIFADAHQGLLYVYNNVMIRLIEPDDNPYLYSESNAKSDGVVRFNPNHAQAGLTLFSSGHATAAFLMTLDGKIVHEWSYPFSKAWPSPPHVSLPVKDSNIFWRRTHVFPNGDLLAIYEASGGSPGSYGLIKVDKASDLVWSYPELVHHDFDVAEDGRIYTLINEIKTEKNPQLRLIRGKFRTIAQRQFKYPILIDSIVELSAGGKELRRVSVLDAFLNSPFANILAIAPARRWDVLHTNSVEVITERFAKMHPQLKAGQLLISLKEISAIAVLDMDKEQIVWAKIGSWREQHDADQLENGNIMIFDNFGHLGPERPWRVVEFNPVSGAEEWIYAGTKERPLYSSIRSGQQLLSNGNVLITESRKSRLLEVTRSGDIVWEFINPRSSIRHPGRRAILCWAQRLDPRRLNFLK